MQVFAKMLGVALGRMEYLLDSMIGLNAGFTVPDTRPDIEMGPEFNVIQKIRLAAISRAGAIVAACKYTLIDAYAPYPGYLDDGRENRVAILTLFVQSGICGGSYPETDGEIERIGLFFNATKWSNISTLRTISILKMKTDLAGNLDEYFASLELHGCFDGAHIGDYLYLVWRRFNVYYTGISTDSVQVLINTLAIDPKYRERYEGDMFAGLGI